MKYFKTKQNEKLPLVVVSEPHLYCWVGFASVLLRTSGSVCTTIVHLQCPCEVSALRWCQGGAGLTELRRVVSSSVFWKHVRKIGIYFPGRPTGPGLCWEVFHCIFNLFTPCWSFRFPISSHLQSLCVSRNLSVGLGCPVSWSVIVHISFSWSFLFLWWHLSHFLVYF